MKSKISIAFSIFLSLARAQLPLSSGYADKCLYEPHTGYRYHEKEAPIGDGHKAHIICASYPTVADFTPVAGASTADECSMACTGSCEGTTWSEISGTEYRCHTFENWDGSVDKTEALVMIMKPPTAASFDEQRDWICNGHNPANNPKRKFVPPNLEIQYHCDSVPLGSGLVIHDEPSPQNPTECALACKAKKDSGGSCDGGVWLDDNQGCYLAQGSDGNILPDIGRIYVKYVEHVMPST